MKHVAGFAIFLCAAASCGAAVAGVGERYGSRDPATCLSRSAAPSSPEIAAKYFACDEEKETEWLHSLNFVTDVRVQVAKPRPFNYNQDSAKPHIDVTKQVYDIRGSFRLWSCFRKDTVSYEASPGRACRSGPQPNADGACWADTFGDWHCTMSDISHTAVSDQRNVAPPQ